MKLRKSMMLLSGLALAASLSVTPALADSASVTAEKSANIRSGAGMNHPVIGWALKGDTLETIGSSGNWTKVALKNGKEGYIYTALLSTGSASAPSAGETTKVTAETSANLRNEPNGKVIGWAMSGDTVTVLEKGSKWTKVELKTGKTGYIHNSLLNGSVSSEKPSAGSSATVTAEVSANLRSEPNGKVVGWVMRGDTVTILDKGAKWTKVELETGKTGYIHNSLLK